MMGMLFNGGDCSQSFTTQEADLFSCQDFLGGPDTAEGSEAWVVVTAQNDNSIVYYRGPVTVGAIYRLEDQQKPGTRFVADQTISVYSSKDETTSNLLQVVDYHSSCSQNLDLKNRFGASQIVEWFNEEQGLITCFSNISYDLRVNIPLTITGSSLTLEKLIIRTNFDGSKNLTEQVYGLVVQAGGAIVVNFDVNIDLAQQGRYTFLTTISGSTDTGVQCDGVSFDTFLIGFPAPEGSGPASFPSLLPPF